MIPQGYDITEYGEVINLKTGKIIKPWIRSGYYNCRCGSKGKKFQVHREVALKYVVNPDPENKKEVNHKDGNKLNNHFSNLEWVSRSENMRHMFDNGLWKRKETFRFSKNEEHYNTKLTNEDVIKIREDYRTGGYSYKDLGLIYNERI